MYNNQSHRMKLIDKEQIYELNRWIARFSLDYFITLHPHNDWGIQKLQEEVHKTMKYVNRISLGDRWYKEEGRNLLPHGFLFIEGVEGEYHAHLLVSAELHTEELLRDIVRKAWGRTVKSGTYDVQRIRPRNPLGLPEYLGKGLREPTFYKAWEPFGPKPSDPMDLHLRLSPEDQWITEDHEAMEREMIEKNAPIPSVMHGSI